MNLKLGLRQFILFNILFLFGVYFSDVHAQVTIGSGKAPAKTSLLQIKDQEADENNITSKTGGFLLPRTELVDIRSLEPYADSKDHEYQNLKRESVGLLVYNMTANEDILPGVYYWDGNKWVSMISTNTTEPSNPYSPDPSITNIDDHNMLKLPNAYILDQGQTLIFPVMKAYAAWKQILDREEDKLSGALQPILLWQTKQDLIKSVSLNAGDKGLNSYIKVETRDIDGNAVIALKMGDEIIWSWHLWVTDYDPDEEGAHRVNNGYTMMDRNLGALHSSSGSILTAGMMYQWGRKDPFPNSASLTGNDVERSIYDIDNNLVEIIKETAPAGDNRPYSLHNPMTFLATNGDWSGMGEAGNYYWNREDGSKGIVDPCPAGWRLPKDFSPWVGLSGDNSYRDNLGLDWDKNGGNGGFYPSAGRREATTGLLEIINSGSRYGYVWIGYSPPNEGINAMVLYFGQWVISKEATGARYPKAMGASVRCMKDE